MSETFDEQLARLRRLGERWAAATAGDTPTSHCLAIGIDREEIEAVAELLRRWDDAQAAMARLNELEAFMHREALFPGLTTPSS